MTYRTFKDLAGLEEAVNKATEGDRHALAQVLRACQTPVYNLCLRFLFDEDDAQDATQEVLIKVCTRLSDFRGDSKFSTWLYRITTNHLLNVKRGKYEGLTVNEGMAYLAEGMQAPAYTGADAPLLEAEVKLGCTTSLLICLNREQRMAYILGEILDFSGAEAASVLEVSEVLFRKRLQLARKHVRAFFERQCGVFNPENPCRCTKQITWNLASGWLSAEKPRFTAGWTTEQIQHMTTALDEVSNEVAIYRNQPPTLTPAEVFTEVEKALEGLPFFR